ncbi:MAG: signal peptidase I [Candidatus Pacebacteria bacterium]|nr:signal peptidase I [Candidatus Paceibacterota bacterium]
MKKVYYIVGGVVGVLILAFVVMQAWGHRYIFEFSGESMAPAYHAKDHALLSYNLNSIKRGDVIVFEVPFDHSKVFAKRIIGVPNETIVIKGGAVSIIGPANDGFELEEAYVTDENRVAENLTIELGADEYFVAGDNRAQSSDSRTWGPIKRSDIRAVIIRTL